MGRNRREFMAAGISAAAASMLPRGQPMELDAWPTPEEIEPPSEDEWKTYRVAEFTPESTSGVTGPRVEVTIPSVPAAREADSELFVQYDPHGVLLNFDITVGDEHAGLLLTISPEVAEEIAARLESEQPHTHMGESCDEFLPVDLFHSHFGAGLIHVEGWEPTAEATLQLTEDVRGLYLRAQVDGDSVTQRASAFVAPDRLELAKQLRVAAAEWRRWPATDADR